MGIEPKEVEEQTKGRQKTLKNIFRYYTIEAGSCGLLHGFYSSSKSCVTSGIIVPRGDYLCNAAIYVRLTTCIVSCKLFKFVLIKTAGFNA